MPASPAAQLAGLIAKFDPAMARTIRAARAALRKQFPTAIELVYDNYNFLVIGFCTAPRASDCLFSLAANAKGLTLMFYYGAALPDPHKLLQGSGTQNRFVRLPSAATLAEPQVQNLLMGAVLNARTPLSESGQSSTVIKSICAKQRPRR